MPEHSSQLSNRSIGCEYTTSCRQLIHTLAGDATINHIQITIPNTLLFQEALEASSLIPTIAHCNLLNVFGENNWAELQAIAQQIKRLNPLHVIEHFTAFRSNGTKTGIAFSSDQRRNPDILKLATDNIKRWQDMLGIPVCIENVAVIENPNRYFDLMLEASDQTQTRIVLDLPHFFLSALTKSSQIDNVPDLAKSLNPIQIHMAGIGVSKTNFLIDRHDLFSPCLLKYAHELFANAEFMTVEQSHSVPPKQLQKYLEICISPESNSAKAPARIADLLPHPADLVNLDLTMNAAKNNTLPCPSTISPVEIDGDAPPSAAVDLYNKYVPFFWPLANVRSFAENPTSSLSDTVKYVSILARWSSAYQSWWAPMEPRIAHMAVFDSSANMNFSGFVVGDEPLTPIAMTSVRVLHHSGGWVEAKLPILNHMTHTN